METIYWLQVLGNVAGLGKLLLVLSVMALVGLIVAIAVNFDEGLEGKACKSIVKFLKWLMLPLFTSIAIVVFVPSEKQLYAIYGIGGTIDYIKSNDTARQLPDKVIKALDEWVDSQSKEDNK